MDPPLYVSLVYRWDVVCRPGGRRLKLQEWTMMEEIAGGGQWRSAFQRVELSSHERRVSFAIIIFYYAIMAARQNKFDTHIDANASTKRQKNIKTVQSNRTDKTRATLLYCAGECVPYSLLYCLPCDVNRRQTIQTFNCNKSLWYQTCRRK